MQSKVTSSSEDMHCSKIQTWISADPLLRARGPRCSLWFTPVFLASPIPLPSALPQVAEACDAVFVSGKESRGARGLRVDFWWRQLRASLRLTVWAPLLPLRIELTDTTLEQVRGWRVPGPPEG